MGLRNLRKTPPKNQHCSLVEMVPNLDIFVFLLGGKHVGLVIYTPQCTQKARQESSTAKQTVPGAMGGPDGQLRKRLGLREDEEVPLDSFTAW